MFAHLTMPKFLKAVTVLLVLYVLFLLGITTWEILAENAVQKELMDLVKVVVSWKVVLGAFGVGAGAQFRVEIKNVLRHLAGLQANAG